jgi:hypothetical protein
MPWFKKGQGKAAPTAAPNTQQIQLPDQLAQDAAQNYGNQDFAGAFRKYAEAVDKIHTMCVMAPSESRIRQPSDRDDPILHGLTSALGANLAMDPNSQVGDLTGQTVSYLMQIADEASHGGYDGSRYVEAARELEGILSRSRQ